MTKLLIYQLKQIYTVHISHIKSCLNNTEACQSLNVTTMPNYIIILLNVNYCSFDFFLNGSTCHGRENNRALFMSIYVCKTMDWRY